MRQQPLYDDSWTEAGAVRPMHARPGVPRKLHGDAAGQPRRRAILTRTFVDEVFPRLLMAQRRHQMASFRVPATPERPGADQVARLTAIVIGGSQTEAAAYVETMGDRGTTTESLFLDLLAPTARRLGEMWEDDTCTFSEVTLGLLRLGNVMRLLSQAFAGEDYSKPADPRALLAQMPGEQHGFGLAMVVQFFRRAGWNIRQEPVTTSADLVGIVRREWFEIIGVSVACSDKVDALAAVIRAVRKQSCNRNIGVMVGGPPFLAHPRLAEMVGADATATDGRHAVVQAHNLLSLVTER